MIERKSWEAPAEPAIQEFAEPELMKEGGSPSVLTLAEKHADLLRYIAQKEARTLELRQQLSQSERELAVLKRKWEGILGRAQPAGPPAPAQPAPTSTMGRIIKELVFVEGSPQPSTKHVQMVPMSSSNAKRPDSVSSATSSAVSEEAAPPLSSTSEHESRSSDDMSSAPPTPALVGPTSTRFPGSANRQKIVEQSSVDPNLPATGPTLHALTTAVGKKWDEITTSNAYISSSKRASILFSSLPSALGAFAAPSSPAPRGPPPKARLPRVPSFLDEDLEGNVGGVAIVPDRSPQPAPASLPLLQQSEEEDEAAAWGW